MNVIREIGTDIASRVGVTETPEGLVELRKPNIGGVIWQRKPTSQFQSWISTLDPEQLPQDQNHSASTCGARCDAQGVRGVGHPGLR